MSAYIYNSFEEIDNDLKALKLKKEINKECIKFSLHRVKTDFYPVNLLENFKGLLQHYMLSIAIKYLRKLVRLG